MLLTIIQLTAHRVSVSEKFIQNCFTKVHFASASEENQETVSEPKINVEEIRGRLQTADLVPEDVSFNEYMESDANLVMCETITKDSIINNLTASKVPADDEEDDDNENCLDESEPMPFMALEALKTVDRYFRTQDNCNTILCNVSKMQQDILAREAV